MKEALVNTEKVLAAVSEGKISAQDLAKRLTQFLRCISDNPPKISVGHIYCKAQLKKVGERTFSWEGDSEIINPNGQIEIPEKCKTCKVMNKAASLVSNTIV